MMRCRSPYSSRFVTAVRIVAILGNSNRGRGNRDTRGIPARSHGTHLGPLAIFRELTSNGCVLLFSVLFVIGAPSPSGSVPRQCVQEMWTRRRYASWRWFLGHDDLSDALERDRDRNLYPRDTA
jgi:hypothetical protein